MTSRPIVVIEANEVPPKVISWYADNFPSSNIAKLIREGQFGKTEVRETIHPEIYPSQTWASLGTGVPYKSHSVYWYGDPKPKEHPFYWQLAAEADRQVGLVGTLHSSPMETQCKGDRFAFAVPDSFAETALTKPESIQKVQSFNLKMTKANARVVATTRPSLEYASSGISAFRNGLRPTTAARLAATVTNVSLSRVPKERLRTAQFDLLSDLHMRLTRSYSPDLSILFTNHIAAAMHRYWYATFPDDWDEELYDESWVALHRDEIPQAMHSLDRSLGRILQWCKANERTLLIISSMGQVGGVETHVDQDKALVVVDAKRFITGLGVPGEFSVGNNMVPNITLTFASEDEASKAIDHIRLREFGEMVLTVDRNGPTVTLTYRLDSSTGQIRIDDRSVGVDQLGIEIKEITDHRCGTHDPIGSLVVWNSPTVELNPLGVDYLEIAPAILQSLDVLPSEHHVSPTFVL